ncbi:MAG: LysR family transcriptional regulator [Peptococcaceae bacterium]|nr:LysR family transcriptional regulator [Peptococcaceae bacterium]MBQ2859623.1 LysR family transcriptional regulator [Peptococcaceae bacterium]
MHTDQIRLLLDLAQTHSFNQTAERHYTTQQSISYSVKQLEKELQVKIFNRSNSGVSFTAEGERVLQCALQMHESYQQLLMDLQKNREQPEPLSSIRLYVSSVLLEADLPEIIKQFNKIYPTTSLVVKEVSHDAILPSLADDSCDMAAWFINMSYLEREGAAYNKYHFTYEPFAEEPSIAVVPANSPLAQKEILTIEDLGSHSRSMFGLLPIDHYGKDINHIVLYENSNPDIHRQLMLENNTICFTSEKIYQKYFADDSFVSLPVDYPVLPNYHLFLHKKDKTHPAYRVLADIISKKYRKQI